MTFTPRPLADGQLANAKGTLYECPSGMRAKVTLITLANTDVGALLCTIYIKPGSTSRVRYSQSIPAGEYIVVSDRDTTIYLDELDLIEGVAATAAKVDYIVQGEEEQKRA